MKRLLPFIIAALLLGFSGCSIRSTHVSSSVVEYLYPDKQEPLEKPAIPSLALPLKVGIAFVPDSSVRYRRSSGFTEQEKMKLMQEISTHFKQYDFVHSIEIIPSAYLKSKGGFTNLDQIRTMYGVDVIALVSYDQHQFTDEGIASISYWTIIGAYIVPGEKNDTHTMVDAVVYDIKSRKMLFRAPGVSTVKGLSTPVNLSEELRKDSLEGFDLASKDLIKNLDLQLQIFKEKVKSSPKEYKVTHTQGYRGGGGSITPPFALALLLLSGYALWRRRK